MSCVFNEYYLSYSTGWSWTVVALAGVAGAVVVTAPAGLALLYRYKGKVTKIIWMAYNVLWSS